MLDDRQSVHARIGGPDRRLLRLPADAWTRCSGLLPGSEDEGVRAAAVEHLPYFDDRPRADTDRRRAARPTRRVRAAAAQRRSARIMASPRHSRRCSHRPRRRGCLGPLFRRERPPAGMATRRRCAALGRTASGDPAMQSRSQRSRRSAPSAADGAFSRLRRSPRRTGRVGASRPAGAWTLAGCASMPETATRSCDPPIRAARGRGRGTARATASDGVEALSWTAAADADVGVARRPPRWARSPKQYTRAERHDAVGALIVACLPSRQSRRALDALAHLAPRGVPVAGRGARAPTTPPYAGASSKCSAGCRIRTRPRLRGR